MDIFIFINYKNNKKMLSINGNHKIVKDIVKVTKIDGGKKLK